MQAQPVAHDQERASLRVQRAAKQATRHPGAVARRTLAFAACLSALGAPAAAGAQQSPAPRPNYHYVSLTTNLPATYLGADPTAFTTGKELVATAFACAEFCTLSILTYRDGKYDLVAEGAYATSAAGPTIGGAVVTDPSTGAGRAALFKGKQVTLIPGLPPDSTSSVVDVAESGFAIVEVSTEAGGSRWLYRNGKTTRLRDDVAGSRLNVQGVIAGGSSLAFRYDSRTDVRTALMPLPTEPSSWAKGINNRGDVLGYSYIGGGRERIGVWRGEHFETYFVQGIPAFPEVSNNLVWNQQGLIVVSDISRGGSGAFLIPRPGERLALSELADMTHPWMSIVDVNERGDLLGCGGSKRGFGDDCFVLERVGG